jgi:hypothetical protein
MESNGQQAKPGDFIVGLDLGQAIDFTALAVVERAWKPHPNLPDRLESHYSVRYLRRWPLKTSYTAVAADVAVLVRTPPLNCPAVAVDQTGVGRAVIDLLRKSELHAWLRPILITAGHATTFGDDGAWHVPKKELVSCLQVLLQARRLQVAPLPERELLIQELLNFRVKITAAANETFESWRERDHDDLVLAVGLAIFWGERHASPPQTLDVRGLAIRHLSLAERIHGPSNAAKRGLFGLGS